MHAPEHAAHNTVQQLLCKTVNFISPEIWSQQARAELNRLQDLWSQQQRENELQFIKLKKSSNDWLNSGKAVLQHLSESMRFSCLSVCPGSVKALVR